MSDYTGLPSSGKLKLKGVKDSSITKKKKKSSKSRPDSTTTSTTFERTNSTTADTINENDNEIQEKSVVLQSLEDEDSQITKTDHRRMGLVDGKEVGPGAGLQEKDPELGERLKTEAERRHDEQRRKRLEDRLKKEGVKTHKQRVEELNKYLSGLSEHHDMPKIGPG